MPILRATAIALLFVPFLGLVLLAHGAALGVLLLARAVEALAGDTFRPRPAIDPLETAP